MDKLKGYVGFYQGKKYEVYAKSFYKAKQKIIQNNKIKNKNLLSVIRNQTIYINQQFLNLHKINIDKPLSRKIKQKIVNSNALNDYESWITINKHIWSVNSMFDLYCRLRDCGYKIKFTY